MVRSPARRIITKTFLTEQEVARFVAACEALGTTRTEILRDFALWVTDHHQAIRGKEFWLRPQLDEIQNGTRVSSSKQKATR